MYGEQIFMEESEGKGKLGFVIAAYDEAVHYHEYDNQTESLSVAKPLTLDTIKTIFKFINNTGDIRDYDFLGMIPKNVLKFSTDECRVIWFTQPGIKQMVFTEKTRAKDGSYPVPHMLWSLRGERLKVYALASEPKDEKQTIYQAPFMNVDYDGRVCMGSARFTTQSSNYEEIIKAAEKGFWTSRFSHTNTMDVVDGDYVEFLKNLKNMKFFPKAKLRARKKTIKSVIDGKE